jgi:hypothetical protein
LVTPDLKNTTDDALPVYLNSLKFKQSHYFTDVRLVLGYTAFLISAAAFAWDYKFGFDATKGYTAAAVVVYFILNGLLTWWIWMVEAGKVFVGESQAGDKVGYISRISVEIPLQHALSFGGV